MRNPFDLSGQGIAAELSQQFAKEADTRRQALAGLDKLVAPHSLTAQMRESALAEVLRVGRDGTQQAIASVRAELERNEKLRLPVGLDVIGKVFGDVSGPATSRMVIEMSRIREEMSRADNLARITGHPVAGTLFDDIDGTAVARMARDTMRARRDWARQREQFGITDFERALGSLGITQGFSSALDQLQSSRYAELLARDVARYVPSGIASQVEDMVRSLDFEPVHQATRELAELLERLREEEGDADTIDDVEDRLNEVDLTAVRQAWAALLAEAFRKSKDLGVQRLLAFNLWINMLSPAALFWFSLVANATIEHGPAMAMKGYRAIARPESTETVGAESKIDARPANPKSRVSEVFFSLDDVTVRSGPSSTQRDIGLIPARHLMRVDARRHGWYRVRFVDPAGEGAQVVGWVRAKGLKHANVETTRLMWCLVTSAPDPKRCDIE